MNNLVVQLLLKTGTFSTDLKTAKGQVQDFQKGCQTAGKSVSAFGSALGINVSTLTKLGGAIGAAALAGKEFKAVIDSSQTSADAFQGAIAGCKGVLDSFNTSIATADFSSFSNGLWDVFNAAKAVQEAIDQLGNTQIAYDYRSKQNMTKFQEAYNVFKDPDSTDQMKKDAIAQMQEAVDAQFKFAANYSNALYKTYVAQVVKKAGSANLNPNRVTMSQFQKAMDIDLGVYGDPEEARAANERQYKEYLRKLKEYGKNNLTAQDDLKKKYKDVIAIHAMLELMKDDELKGVAQLLGGMEDARQVALSMEKTLNRARKGETVTPKTPKVQTVEVNPEEGSLAYWQKILREETEARDRLVAYTNQWNYHNDKVIEAQKEIDKLTKKVEELPKIVSGSAEEYDLIISELEKKLKTLEIGTPEYQQGLMMLNYTKAEKVMAEMNSRLDSFGELGPQTLSEWEEFLSILVQMRNTLPVDSEQFKELSEQIKTTSDYINGLKGIKTSAPETDTWDKFTQSMSNVSTIVSSLTNTFKENSEVTAASILQMVATALPAIGSLISAISALTATEAVEAGTAAVGKAVSSSKHWIEAIAAVASLGAVVAAAISAAKKPATQRFANGGIVGGSSFTGDRVSAQVNSGEMILNKSQQANLFKMANGEGQGRQVEFHISGTDLVGVLNNNTRKSRITR